jgi:hypothetical protein
LFLIAVMIPTVSVLMIAHAIEVVVWSLAYSIVGAALDECPARFRQRLVTVALDEAAGLPADVKVGNLHVRTFFCGTP